MRVEEASPQTLVLAFLGEGKPLEPKELAERVKGVLKDRVNAGSVYNIGPRLDGKKIRRGDRGWELIKGQRAPVLHKGHIWAPPDILSAHDLAAFRRMAVEHLLGSRPGGMKTAEIHKVLARADWLKTPISKDLIDDDLEALETAGRVRRAGRAKRWKLTL